MCPKHSPPFRAAPFPTQWLSPVRISHLSNGTMKRLRLPLSFLHLRFPSACVPAPVIAFLRCRMMMTLTTLHRPFVQELAHLPFSQQETVGSPVFPYSPSMSLMHSLTPPGLRQDRLWPYLHIVPAKLTTKTPDLSTLSRLYHTPLTLAVYASYHPLE